MTQDNQNDELTTQADFAIKHGKNTTDRMTPDLLKAICDTLTVNGIVYNGEKRTVKQLGEMLEQEGQHILLFDVLCPDDTFDHVEFKVVKSGWGRSL